MTAPLNRKRLAKVLALLASDRDGEVLAAAARAVAMLKDAGVTFDGILSGAPEPIPERRDDGWAAGFAAGRQVAAEQAFLAGRADGLAQGRQDAEASIRRLEAQLERALPPLNWPDLADRFHARHLHGPGAAAAKLLALRAATGRVTIEDRIALRRFAETLSRGTRRKRATPTTEAAP